MPPEELLAASFFLQSDSLCLLAWLKFFMQKAQWWDLLHCLPVSTSYWHLSSVVQVDHLEHRGCWEGLISSFSVAFFSLYGIFGKEDIACIRLVGCILGPIIGQDVAPESKSWNTLSE